MRNDLTCDSAEKCCGPNKGPLIQLDNVSRRVFDGNGYTIHHGEGALTMMNCVSVPIDQCPCH
jgi:hypothetical protein